MGWSIFHYSHIFHGGHVEVKKSKCKQDQIRAKKCLKVYK